MTHFSSPTWSYSVSVSPQKAEFYLSHYYWLTFYTMCHWLQHDMTLNDCFWLKMFTSKFSNLIVHSLLQLMSLHCFSLADEKIFEFLVVLSHYACTESLEYFFSYSFISTVRGSPTCLLFLLLCSLVV